MSADAGIGLGLAGIAGEGEVADVSECGKEDDDYGPNTGGLETAIGTALRTGRQRRRESRYGI